ncbi:hypothetical protein L218DRAFT_883570, partial [Marasmius fiardii PR-910]
LLQKRSRIYSDRAFSNALQSAGWGFSLPSTPDNDEWQINRRLHHQSLNARSMPRLHPVIKQKVHQFLQSLSSEPNDFMDHIEILSGGSMLTAMFGLYVTSAHSKALQCSKTAMTSLDKVMAPHFVFVDTYLPWYHYLPGWFPVLGHFKQDLQAGLNSLRVMRELAVEHVEKLIVQSLCLFLSSLYSA